MRTHLLLLIFSAALLPTMFGQRNSGGANGSFTVEVTPKEVTLGEAIQVTFSIDQFEKTSFKAPDWAAAGFSVVSTSQSSSMSISQGKSRSTSTFQYWLMPLASGTATIPPATLDTRDGSLKTDAVPVTVMPAADGSRSLAPPAERKKSKVDLPTIRI